MVRTAAERVVLGQLGLCAAPQTKTQLRIRFLASLLVVVVSREPREPREPLYSLRIKIENCCQL